MNKKSKSKKNGLRHSIERISEHLKDDAPVSRRVFLGRAGKVMALGAMSHFIMLGMASNANGEENPCCKIITGVCDNCDPATSKCDASGGQVDTPNPCQSCDPGTVPDTGGCSSQTTDGCAAVGTCDSTGNFGGNTICPTCDAAHPNIIECPLCDISNGGTDPGGGDTPGGCGGGGGSE